MSYRENISRQIEELNAKHTEICNKLLDGEFRDQWAELAVEADKIEWNVKTLESYLEEPEESKIERAKKVMLWLPKENRFKRISKSDARVLATVEAARVQLEWIMHRNGVLRIQ